MKIGFSKDIHKLKKGTKKPLILGGFTIYNSNYYIDSHSDGDLILHSITSAILGAIGLKTIGEYFSDKDDNNKNRSSVDFLNFSLSKLVELNMRIESIDLCIVCEKIILNQHLEYIRDSLKQLIRIDNIGIKATRFEDKRKKYIECYCSLIID